jgi:hypothetical protein
MQFLIVKISVRKVIKMDEKSTNKQTVSTEKVAVNISALYFNGQLNFSIKLLFYLFDNYVLFMVNNLHNVKLNF